MCRPPARRFAGFFVFLHPATPGGPALVGIIAGFGGWGLRPARPRFALAHAGTGRVTLSSPPSSMSANDPNLALLQQARDQIAQGDLKKAAQTLQKAQKQWPRDPRVFLLAGVMAEKSGNLPGAFDALRRAVNLAPDWGPGLLELALLHARQNQFQDAIANAEKVAALEPQNPRVLAGVVDIAHRAGHLEMAVRHLRRGLALVPGDATLRQALARDLQALGQYDEALALWDGLLAEQPADPHALVGKVQTCLAAGRAAEAQASAEALLAQAPDDAVYQYLAQRVRGDTPAQQPAGLTVNLFDGMADTYDRHVVGSLKYQLPRQVAQALRERHAGQPFNVLDLGCGTGLLGLYLGEIEGFLIGVDLSARMLEQAARHGVYDRFHQVNLHDALAETPDGLYDAITALDVFIYAGDLGQAVPNALRILKPSGQLVFSCEAAPEDGPDLVLQPSERYAHRRSQVEALCRSAGFAEVDIAEQVLRHEGGQPVQGFVVTATKAAA